MAKPRRLSGQDIVRIFQEFGFHIKSQNGSHLKLARTALNREEVIIVPIHKELKTGTVVGVFRQATAYISESELCPHFYTD